MINRSHGEKKSRKILDIEEMHISKPAETWDDHLESPTDNAIGHYGARGREKKSEIEGLIRRTSSQFCMHKRSIK